MKLIVTEFKTLPEVGSDRIHGRLFVHLDKNSELQSLDDGSDQGHWKLIALFKTALPEVIARLGKTLTLDPKTIKWSQKAGCSCGCSPGFILPNCGPINVWADVKEELS